MTAALIIAGYLALLLLVGAASSRYFRGTAADYFLASRGIGSFLLVMSLFGTTMTAFALVGSTGEAFQAGIGVYGVMASWSGIVHSACFFFVGIRLWALGKRHGYLTQIQFFRDRFESDRLGLVLFPLLVALVIPYLLIGIMGAGQVIEEVTRGTLPGAFPAQAGAIPYWVGALAICLVVLAYVFFGGIRGAAWANAFQTLVFVGLGIVAMTLIADRLGGAAHATRMVAERNPTRLQRAVHPDDRARYEAALAAYEARPAARDADASDNGPAEHAAAPPAAPRGMSALYVLSYFFIPLSVGMFPHVFQHWLTARNAHTFRLAVVAHPLLIMAVWVPCVLIGVWATSAVIDGRPVVPPDANPNAVLGLMVNELTGVVVGGLLTAGILAAIMSSLDSQFLALGSIFTNDIVAHYAGRERVSDRQRVLLGRGFVVVTVLVAYALALVFRETRAIFTLGVWCFSGFAGLFPLVVAAVYWPRVTKAGAYASMGATAGAWAWLFAQSGFGAERGFTVFGMLPVVPIVAASSVALVVVSLVTRPPSSATLYGFFSSSRTPAARSHR